MNRIDKLKKKEGPEERIYPPLSINKAAGLIDWITNIVVYFVMKNDDRIYKFKNKKDKKGR